MLEARNLVKDFGKFRAVNNVSFAVNAGEVMGLLGTNGAGKTTIVKIFSTLLRPTAGDALVEGISVHADTMEVRKRLGYLPETPSLYDHLTGREFLQFIGSLRNEKNIDGRVNELGVMLGLEGFMDSLVGTYSKGLKQRLAFAQAIFHRPSILLLDEPLLGLDPRYAKLVKDMLGDFCKGGGCAIVTTHMTDMAEKICSRIAVIHLGVLRAMGTLEEIKAMTATSNLEEAFISLVEERH
jgi:ABC-2 type transport system ATP-binding protein